MFDQTRFNEMPKFSLMEFHFTYDMNTERWLVHEGDGVIATIDSHDEEKIETTGVIQKDINILSDFEIFKRRPEYQLAHMKMPTEIKELQDIYETLFAGSVFVRAMNHNPGCNPDDAWPQIDRALNWLRTTDFYKAPASSQFHDSFPSGLVFHSIKTAINAVDLMKCNKFNDCSKIGDVVFCSLVHDWCKINLYEQYMKNVKNEETGQWEKIAAYRYTGNAVINLGHGVSSMFLINKFFKLNIEEASAIRWHMGAYRTSDADFNELQTCNETFPMVHLLQFADQLSLVKF